MAPAAALVAAMLAELEVAVLVLEVALVAEDVFELVLDEAAEEPTASPAPLSLLPLSPLPLEPTGDCGIAEAKRKRVKARRNLRSCMVR